MGKAIQKQIFMKNEIEKTRRYRSQLEKSTHPYILKMSKLIMIIHCECGICEHKREPECIKKECDCCNNFHLRSGQC